MNNLVINVDDEKTRLTEKISEHYARNVINIEEYERLVEYVSKIETKKEVSIIETMIQGYSSINSASPAGYGSADEAPVKNDRQEIKKRDKREHVTIFSMRTTNIQPINGRAGKFTNVFGANKIIVDNLPPGRTVMKLEIVFGLTEIVVARNIRIINNTEPVFAMVSCPDDTDSWEGNCPELLIKGEVVFGNVTIIRK